MLVSISIGRLPGWRYAAGSLPGNARTHRTLGTQVTLTTLWAALSWGAVCVFATSVTAADEARAKLPNIVVILADDMGFGDPGCYNPRSKTPTPNIDLLARQGIRFTDAHSPAGVCTPTRYGLLTGRYPWRTRMASGVLWGYSRSLIEPGRLTVAELLKQQGYHTACIGKWHLGFQEYEAGDPARRPGGQRTIDGPQVNYDQPLRPGPLTVGFDYFFGIPASLDMEPYLYVENDRPVEQATEQVAASQHRRQGGGGFWRAGPIAPSFRHADVLPKTTEKAVAWLKQQSDERPFFLYFPLSAPHTPWLPADEFRGRSKAGYYGDFVVQVDFSIGQVLAALDERKLSDNTLVIVTSDNGSHWPLEDVQKWDHASNLHWRGQKSDIWEGGHRVPFVARWPGKIAPGGTSDETICLTDLLATCAEIVGRELPDDAGEDSFSFFSVLLGRQTQQPIRPATVYQSGNGTLAIRSDVWKLVVGNLGSGGFTAPAQVRPGPQGPKGQLYRLDEDPSEQKNLYEAHPEIVEQLTELLERYRREGRSRPTR
jgi:arylsulfatase A